MVSQPDTDGYAICYIFNSHLYVGFLVILIDIVVLAVRSHMLILCFIVIDRSSAFGN